MEVRGKIACVIGATGGIGKNVVTALAEKGVNLILVSRDMTSLDSLERDIKNFKITISKYTCDVSRFDSIRQLVHNISKDYKHLDLLFHLAGIGVYKYLGDIQREDWQLTMDINLNSVFYITQGLLTLLKKSEKAYVIASGSGMGKIALSGRSAYCTSKFALRGLMLSLAKEFKHSNINFVHLTLGSVLTTFGPLSLTEKKRKHDSGKGYLEPGWLASHIIKRIENETLEAETPIYPKHYFAESRRDKR